MAPDAGDIVDARPAAHAAPSSGRAWFAATLLCLAYMLSILDRQILNLLAPEIQRDLDLTDLQLSYLQGFFFVILYVTMGPVFGWLADRKPRKVVAALGIGIWSFATAVSSMAGSFVGLALARLGVGSGESALGPAATSMISDLFSARNRPKALALFGIGPLLGAAFALLGAPLFIPETPVDMGVAGIFQPWQMAFLIAGAPGLVVAAAILMLREPARHGIENTEFKPGIAAALRYMLENRRAYIGAFGGSILILAVGTASNYNIPLYFHRTFGWDHYQTGHSIGLLNLFTMIPSALAGGWLASALLKRGRAESTYLIMMGGAVIFSIPSVLTWLMPTPNKAMFMLGVQNVGAALISPLMAAITADLSPNRYRGQIMALFLSGVQLFAAGLAPIGVAFLTEQFFGIENIRYSLSTFAICLTPLGLLAYLYGLPAVRVLAVQRAADDPGFVTT